VELSYIEWSMLLTVSDETVDVVVVSGTVLDGLVVFTIIYGSTDDKNFLK